MSRSPTALAAALALAGLPRPAGAWGGASHRTVALIAQDKLRVVALSKVQAILGPDVGLDAIATCADDIKHAGVKCGGSFYVPKDSSTDDWHFIDIPESAAPTEGLISAYCSQGGQPRGCVVDQVTDHLA